MSGARNISGLVCALNILWIVGAPKLAAQVPAAEGRLRPSAESYLDQSRRYYQVGRFADSIQAARAALKLPSNYPAAWNNIAASYNSLGLWEDGIRGTQEAPRLQPDYELAGKNLAWAKLNQESTPESCPTQSWLYYQRGKFNECIRTARLAISMRPLYAEAWNNIAAAYNSMSQWGEGIRAAEEAIRLKPDFQLARNNLAWARAQEAKEKSCAGR
jgi:tetratricopeptide (TPR) repeat protein